MDITKYDARDELSELMNSELNPNLTEQAEALLKKITDAGPLSEDQLKRIKIQLLLSDELGLLDYESFQLYPDSDAANLTLLSLRHKQETNEAIEREQAEEAKRLLGDSGKLSGMVIYSRQPFNNSGSMVSDILEDSAKEVLSAGTALVGNRAGLSGGPKMVHAYKMYLGKELSKQSALYGTTASLGGIPPEICKEKFGYTPPIVKNRFGKDVESPTIVIQPSIAAMALFGSKTISGKEMKIAGEVLDKLNSHFYFRRISDNRIEGTPVIISKKMIIERKDKNGRIYAYMVLSLNPDFSTEVMEKETGASPKDYISIEAENLSLLSGGTLFNALFDYAMYHSNKSGMHKVRFEALKAELIEQCPEYKKNPQRFRPDFEKARDAIEKTGFCKIKASQTHFLIIYTKKKKFNVQEGK